MNIIIIGAGNLASHLGRAFKEAGHSIKAIYNHRKTTSALEFAHELNARFSTDFNTIDTADFYFIAVKDDAIEETVKRINVNSGVVLHTSGTISIDVLNKFKRFGVFYPVQSFSKNIKLSFKSVPVCLEASDQDVQKTLKEFARSLTNEVHFVSSEKRLKLHLAAVFVNNFTNYLFSISSEILKKEEIPFNILKPLAEETLRKVFDNSASIRDLQTGPAKRKDEKTIQSHLEILKDFPGEYAELYRVFTENIRKMH